MLRGEPAGQEPAPAQARGDVFTRNGPDGKESARLWYAPVASMSPSGPGWGRSTPSPHSVVVYPTLLAPLQATATIAGRGYFGGAWGLVVSLDSA